MIEKISNSSNGHEVKHHTIEVIVDVSKCALPLKYSDPTTRLLLDTGLYILLGELQNYLQNQPKTVKKQKKIKTNISEILASLRESKTIKSIQWDSNAEIKKILNEVEWGWKKIFSNLIIKTSQSSSRWERLITFLKEDFEKKDFDPKEAMKDALERFN